MTKDKNRKCGEKKSDKVKEPSKNLSTTANGGDNKDINKSTQLITSKNIDNSHNIGNNVIIGEGTPNKMEISLQKMQSIYYELFCKTEEMSKHYKEQFKVTLNDLEQLNYKIQQVCEQYRIVCEHSEFSIFYHSDTQESFSSFEKFQGFSGSSPSAVESVLFKYKFLIQLPKNNQAQSYSLSIRISSLITINNKIRKDIPELSKIVKLLGSSAATVKVEYVDYMVAQNIFNVVDGWFKTLSISKSPFKLIEGKSHYIPLICCYLVGIFVAFLIFKAIPISLKINTTLPQFATFVFVAFIGLFATYKIAGHLGNLIEREIDRWTPISYIQLTDGDKKQIEEAEAMNKNSIVKAIIKVIVAVFYTVVINMIANWLTSLPI